MTVEFNKRVITNSLGNIISDTSDLKIEDGKMTGMAVDNFKKEIIESINEEIIKPKNEKIRCLVRKNTYLGENIEIIKGDLAD